MFRTRLNRLLGKGESAGDPFHHRDLGDAARDHRDWSTAVHHYQLHLERQPEDFAIWVQLGHALKESGSLVQALIAYSRARRINDEDADLLLSLGHLFKLMGHKADAAEYYRKSAILEPGGPAVHELNGLGAFLSPVEFDVLEPTARADRFAAAPDTLRRRSIPKAKPYGNTPCDSRMPSAASRGRSIVVRDLEARFHARFSEPDSSVAKLFVYEPYEPMAVGDLISHHFTVDTRLESLSLVFFTYCERNRTQLRVRLASVQDDLSDLVILEHKLSDDDILDGKSCHITLSNPIEDAARHVFRLDVEVVGKPEGLKFSAASISGGVAGLTLCQGVPQPRTLAMQVNAAPVDRFGRKYWAFVSACPGDSYRYRCVHQAEMITGLGYGVDVFPPSDAPWQYILDHYCVVTLHRVHYDDVLAGFLDEARRRLITVIYDTDDLIFSTDHLHEIDAYLRMDPQEQGRFVDGLMRFAKALSNCDIVSVSTNVLRDAVQERWPSKPVWVSRNILGADMVEGARKALATIAPPRGDVRIGYLSGTKTHQKDFSVCAEALRLILRQHLQTTLVIVGHLDASDFEAEFPGRVEIIPFVPWQSLPEIYRTIDINLAPLEYDNTFTAAKSELKWLEAGLLGIPTVASRTGAFADMVRDGVDGLLCSTTQQWRDAIEALASDQDLRARIGAAAKARVEAECLTTGASVQGRFQGMKSTFDQYVPPAGRKPTIAFVLMAPIAQTGGGYKKIFMLANYLKTRFEVTVYVHPFVHLAGKTDGEVRRFIEDEFGFEGSNIIVGHANMEPADIWVATNWPTVQPLVEFADARVRTYFVQDYEPDFYESGSSFHHDAMRTYTEPLSIITIGKYLAKKLERFNRLIMDVPFAIDESFFKAADRRVEGAERDVLFFARPNIPRRNFALGVEALGLLKKRRPDLVIAMYGLDEGQTLPFEYDNLGIIDQGRLAEEMARSRVHLSFSMTNVSTVIYEAMAAGCACVEADVESVRPMVRDGVDCLLAEPTPEGVCAALSRLLDDPAYRAAISEEGRRAVANMTEGDMCRAFEDRLWTMWLTAGALRH